jgi:cyclophilin family peptidyl-prolyl cis-trans isomerase/protein-disulfide isomerase
MFKRWALFLLIGFLLAACGGGSAPTAEEPTPSPATNTAIPQTQPSVSAISACTMVSALPTPSSEELSLFPQVGADDHILGAESAAVTIVEYSDFQCPYCAEFASVMDDLLEKYPDDLRLVFRHYPLVGTPEQPFHDKAALSAQAAEAANKQDKFWEMHDLLFERQSEWVQLPLDDFEEWLVQAAGDLGLDVEQFSSDLTSPELEALALKAWEDALEIGIPHTPFLLINSRIWPTNVPANIETVSALVEMTKLEERQFTECPPMVIDTAKQYIATLHTTKGDIVVELLTADAPLAVNSFVFLAQNNWFDGVMFHRVLPGFVAQSGDPTGTGYGGPGYAFENEVSPDLNFDRSGLVAMANAGADSNGSQFFITYAPLPDLDGGYTIFGQVITGMEVAESLTPRNPAQGGDLPPGDLILDITIDER